MFAQNGARDNPSLCIFAVDFEDTRDEDYDSDGSPISVGYSGVDLGAPSGSPIKHRTAMAARLAN